MGRGKTLSDEEKGRIRGLREAGVGIRAIARKTKRSPDAVLRVLQRLKQPPRREKRFGRPTALSEKTLRRLVRSAAKGDASAFQLKDQLSLDCSTRTVRRSISAVDWLVYSKMENTLQLSAAHKQTRLEWAKKMVVRPGDWGQIIFSDEKKWNMDGPDGLQHYWRDLRQPPRQTNSRQMGGGSVMVWVGFSALGKTELAVLVDRQASSHYVYTLSEYLLHFAHRHYGVAFVFQQDNAAIHTSRETMAFFKEQDVHAAGLQ
jgi:IS30 family transposase